MNEIKILSKRIAKLLERPLVPFLMLLKKKSEQIGIKIDTITTTVQNPLLFQQQIGRSWNLIRHKYNR